MNRQLGTLELNDGCVWEGWGNWSARRETIKRTTDGGVVVIQQQLSKGQPIKLAFPRQYACLTYQEAITIWQMAKAVGTSYLLQWDGQIEQVMFVGDPQLEPLQNIAEPEENLWHGEINLITV